MGDHDGEQALAPDMHLKPLDNEALLKPLRKIADAPVSPAKTDAAAKAPEDDEDDDDLFAPAPKPKQPATPEVMKTADAEPSTAAPEPPAEPVIAAPAPPPEPEPVPEPEPEPVPQPPVQPTPEPAPPRAAKYRPTDEQMHMMELMKSIFASALNAGLAGGQPPQFPVPESAPDTSHLRDELMALQQKIRDAGIPVVIVIEGLSASGKGAMLSELVEGLDSRGCQTHPVRRPNCVEEAYPPMHRYWVNMPKKGDIALFCSSWYGELNKTCFEREDEIPELLPQRLNEIISMESQLICDGTLILKFFLHISQQEQYDRLKKMEGKKSTAWQVVGPDREQNRRFDEYMKGMDNLMSITNLKGAPWHIVDATNLKECKREIYQTVIKAFKDALRAHRSGLRPWDVPMLPNLSPVPPLGFPLLHTIDLNKHLDVPYDDAHRELKKRLRKLQVKLYRRGIPLIIAFEGWDAAGKGGAIRRLNAAMDARGFTVAPISAPTPLELSHHYLWRFFRELPPKGHVTIFDRTWYGRVMVERVENLCTEPQWQRAYEEINRFEKLWTDSGAIIVKFWLQIDPDTQLMRFEARKADPEKQWKLTDEDWRNREKWLAYEQAVDEVLQRTHTASAPWTVVEANDKEYARIKVLQTVVDTIEKHLDKDDEDED